MGTKMKRAKLLPIVASAAFGLVLVGGVAVMAVPKDDATPEAVASTKPTEPKSDDAEPKSQNPRGNNPKDFGGGLGLGANPEHLAAMIDQMPEAMRTDLANVLVAKSDERTKLIEAMIAKAKSGGYGEEIAKQVAQGEDMARSFGDKAKKRWDDMPAELKEDLAAARKLKGNERREAMEKVIGDARAGKYGDDVKNSFDRFNGFGDRHHKGKKAKDSKGS